jgi:hypothetical protein
MPPAQPAVAKPASAPAMPAAPAKPPAKAAQPARAAISRSDLQREIRKAVEEALRAQQAQKGQPVVEVKVNLPSTITVRVVREGTTSSPTPPPAPPAPKQGRRPTPEELDRATAKCLERGGCLP